MLVRAVRQSSNRLVIPVLAAHKPVVTVPLNRRKMSSKRPTSPHITIYKFPIAAIGSISNRIAGVALSAGVVGMASLGLMGSCDIPSYVFAFKESAPVLVPFAKMAVAFPLVYHYAAGVRHLYWDHTGANIEKDWVDQSTKVLVAGTAAITLAAGFISI